MIVNYTVTRKHRRTCWLAQLMMVHIATMTGVSVFLVFVNQCPNILLQRNVLPQILQVMVRGQQLSSSKFSPSKKNLSSVLEMTMISAYVHLDHQISRTACLELQYN